jgi:polar amino acid transport system substrate-binding protein
MLRLNRLRGVAAQDATTDPYLSFAGFSDIEKIQPPIKTKDYFVLFSHSFYQAHPQLVEKLWDRIALIRDDVNKKRNGSYRYGN